MGCPSRSRSDDDDDDDDGDDHGDNDDFFIDLDPSTQARWRVRRRQLDSIFGSKMVISGQTFTLDIFASPAVYTRYRGIPLGNVCFFGQTAAFP